jgi:hypothetical protein
MLMHPFDRTHSISCSSPHHPSPFPMGCRQLRKIHAGEGAAKGPHRPWRRMRGAVRDRSTDSLGRSINVHKRYQ